MKVTNQELLNINMALIYLSSEKTGGWYGVSKNLRKLKKPLEEFSASQKEIQEKFGEKDKEGNLILNENAISFGDNQEKADELFNELLEEKVDVDFYTISMDKFEGDKLDGLRVEPLMDVVIVD